MSDYIAIVEALRDELCEPPNASRWKHRADALDALLRDARRLDWLEWPHGDTTICPPGEHGGAADHWLIAREDLRVPIRGYRHVDDWSGTSVRAAIDAAMGVK